MRCVSPLSSPRRCGGVDARTGTATLHDNGASAIKVVEVSWNFSVVSVASVSSRNALNIRASLPALVPCEATTKKVDSLDGEA